MKDIGLTGEAVQTRENLSQFLEEVAEGLRAGTLVWENSDLADFLEAMSAWIADMDGYFQNRGDAIPDPPTWRLFAQIVVAASQYE